MARTKFPGPQTSTSHTENIIGALARLRELLGRVPRVNMNLSMFQTVVGLMAGVMSIFGALFAIPSSLKPPSARAR